MAETIYCINISNGTTYSSILQLIQQHKKGLNKWLSLYSDSSIWREFFDDNYLASACITNLETITICNLRLPSGKIPHQTKMVTDYLDQHPVILYQETAHLERLIELLPKDRYSFQELTQQNPSQ